MSGLRPPRAKKCRVYFEGPPWRHIVLCESRPPTLCCGVQDQTARAVVAGYRSAPVPTGTLLVAQDSEWSLVRPARIGARGADKSRCDSIADASARRSPASRRHFTPLTVPRSLFELCAVADAALVRWAPPPGGGPEGTDTGGLPDSGTGPTCRVSRLRELRATRSWSWSGRRNTFARPARFCVLAAPRSVR